MATNADLEDWMWSEDHGDYYRYQQRQRPGGTSTFDLIWGRRSLGTLVGPPVASAPVHQHQYQHQHQHHPNPQPSLNDPGPKPTAPYPFFPPTQPVRQPATRHQFSQQQAIPTDVILHQNLAPFNNYEYVKYPPDRPDSQHRADRSSSVSTEDPRAHTPATTETPTPSATEPPLQSNPKYTGDDVPKASDTSATYPTPEGRYESILRPRNYFKKGRVFKVIWLEPRGEAIVSTTPNDPATPVQAGGPLINPLHTSMPTSEAQPASTPSTSTQMVHAKPRIFVVVRQKSKHCLCVPVYTYSQQATSKPGVNPEDHAPIIKEGNSVEYHENEEKEKLKKTLIMVLEDPTVQWSPMSRINLGKVQSVEYNLKVRTIGRLTRDSTTDLETLFREAIGLDNE